ncbi:MAG: hypothetical protein CV087_10700 [Candidatus Brocadia sp. WS118]|nr:MAG: hypothetical protein CV087_10700 [Candidatus Brocadia sp. WS118]
MAHYKNPGCINLDFFSRPYNRQHGYENFETFQGKTDHGIDWSSTPEQVIKAYGKPKEEYIRVGWRRMAYEGIDFCWENGVMVRIGITAK